jgi:hypothetical protein
MDEELYDMGWDVMMIHNLRNGELALRFGCLWVWIGLE